MVTTRRGQKSASEANPLLEVAERSMQKMQYESATGQSSGKERRLRAVVDKQIQKQASLKAGGGTFKSIFAPKHHPAANDKPKRTHSALYTYFNPKSRASSARCFQQFITMVIVVDMIFYIISTEPKFEGVPMFYYAECITSSIFLIEYLARLYVCTEQVSCDLGCF